MTINIYEAKSQLSRLVDQAARGEDVIISRQGKPIARLTRLSEKRKPVRFGVLKGKLRLADDDFDAPLSDEIIAGFEGR